MTNLIVHKRIFLVVRRGHDVDTIIDGFHNRTDALRMALLYTSFETRYAITELDLQDLPADPRLM